MKSYLERKEKRNDVVRATIVLLAVLAFLNYLLLYRAGLYQFLLSLILISTCNIVAIWAFCSYLGIKLPKRKLPEWLNNELNLLEKNYDAVYDNISSSLQSEVARKNENCPKCTAGREGIVDKIRRVKGEVDGDFFVGFGSVRGGTDTGSVNHCNHCGNEWKKQETKNSDMREAAMDQILRPMYYFFSEDQYNNSDKLQKFNAKAIKIFIKKHQDGYIAETLKKLSERELRKYGCL